jgi:hypothetical protein
MEKEKKNKKKNKEKKRRKERKNRKITGIKKETLQRMWAVHPFSP